MTIFDTMKTNNALCEGVGPHRPRVAGPLLEQSGRVRALSFARCRPRGPPGAC
jgi:hypothetical protein